LHWRYEAFEMRVGRIVEIATSRKVDPGPISKIDLPRTCRNERLRSATRPGA
jgi:hypothetical protein